MKIFKQMLPGQKLILIKAQTSQPAQIVAIVPRSIIKKQSLFKIIFSAICAICTMILMIPEWIATTSSLIVYANCTKIYVLTFLAGVLATSILEDIATDYVIAAIG